MIGVLEVDGGSKIYEYQHRVVSESLYFRCLSLDTQQKSEKLMIWVSNFVSSEKLETLLLHHMFLTCQFLALFPWILWSLKQLQDFSMVALFIKHRYFYIKLSFNLDPMHVVNIVSSKR